MKYAVIEGQRSEAQPLLSATCPACGAPMVAKCGQQRIWHWAHMGLRNCDAWWESETEWHRNWKNEFPRDRQEVLHRSDTGEKHIADVKAGIGTVIEFQHSALAAAERALREAFYGKMVWVVDGRRRIRDLTQFKAVLGQPICHLPIHAVTTESCALLRDWQASRVPVYFDFGDGDDGHPWPLWRRDPLSHDRISYLSPVLRRSFLRDHISGNPIEERCSEIVKLVLEFTSQRSRRSAPLVGFERYAQRRQSARRRM